jgi:PAS domain S-box-containing protein
MGGSNGHNGECDSASITSAGFAAPGGEQRQFLAGPAGGCAIYVMDAQGAVLSWTPGAGEATGDGSAGIVGRHFSGLFNEQDRAAGLPARMVEEAALKGHSLREGWRTGKDGSQGFAEIAVYPMRGAGGQPAGYTAVVRETAGKRHAASAPQQMDALQGSAQKMEALGHLTGSVAHDFSNVLMVIGGYLQTLQKAAGENPRAVRAAEAIERAVERGQSLTRQLLAFSRKRTLNPVVTGIGERVEAFRKMLGSSNAAPAKIATSIPPDIWPVIADTAEFELALLNIVLDARDAMPQSAVTIAAENAQLKPADTPDRLEGDFAALIVSSADTATPGEAAPGVSAPSAPVKGVGRGSALRLAQVRSFAEQSGGTVTVESKPGQGAKLTLYLPRVEGVQEQPAAEAPVKLHAGGKALLVDDNRDVLEVSALYLQELGYEVDTMDSAQPALRAVEREAYSLVVSDVVMAGMDGIDLAEAIRRRHPDMPIVLVTGYSRVPDSVGREFVLLRKPYQLDDLSRAAAAAIAAAGLRQAGSLANQDSRRPLR